MKKMGRLVHDFCWSGPSLLSRWRGVLISIDTALISNEHLGGSHLGFVFGPVNGGIYVELRSPCVRSSADLFVDGMRGYWASSAQRTQL